MSSAPIAANALPIPRKDTEADSTSSSLSSSASSISSSCVSPPSASSIEINALPKAVSDAVRSGAFLRKAAKLSFETESNVALVSNSLRILSADAVENAQSGHPGMPLGMAPTAATLWDIHLRFNPANPKWINRDRFVLSAGHGSILLYSLLYLYGYESIGKKELKSFRKRGSRAAGHPENILTPGVEVTTGALGQGIANAVGFAMAESHLAALYNRPDAPNIIDHFTYCFLGDGCLMEGVASEACSLAGHWKLGKLIVFYDDNNISIEGSTDLAFTEDVPERFRAYGWQVLEVANGNADIHAIHNAIVSAKAETQRPSLIKVTTTIGYGAPSKQGTNAAHGSCLGGENIAALRQLCGWTYAPFEIPEVVTAHTRTAVRVGARYEEDWNCDFGEYREKYPDLASQFESCVVHGEQPSGWANALAERCAKLASGDFKDAMATRALSQAAINCLAVRLPHFMGGSADLGPSNLTRIVKEEDYSSISRAGRNIHFGVREHAMGSITNGIALYGSNGGVVPYCATFLVFSDYMRAAIRTAALSRAGTIFVMTHDSVLLGEDGPTHQPVEHLWSLRSMPNVLTIRPADGVEVGAAYELAVSRRQTPSVIVLSRQKFGVDGRACRAGALRGGYVHSDGRDVRAVSGDAFQEEFHRAEEAEVVVIATGSELGAVSAAANVVRERRRRHVRVVSMPCLEAFEEQSWEYKRNVLGGDPAVMRERTLVVEAGATGGWWRYATHFVTVDEFGISASARDIQVAYGLTVDNIASRMEEVAAMDGSGA